MCVSSVIFAALKLLTYICGHLQEIALSAVTCNHYEDFFCLYYDEIYRIPPSEEIHVSLRQFMQTLVSLLCSGQAAL